MFHNPSQSTDSTPPERAKSTLGRRLRRAVVGVAALLIASIVFLPQLLSTLAARNWLLIQARPIFAPGKLEVGRFHFSWFQPTRLDRIVVRDEQGEAVVVSDQGSLSLSLGGILFDRSAPATLTLPHAKFDLDRRADGSVDIMDAIHPIHNTRSLTIKIDRGTLSLRASQLPRPIVAPRFDLTIEIQKYPGPIKLSDMFLAESNEIDAPYLRLQGNLSRELIAFDAPPDLNLNVQAERWPIAISTTGGERSCVVRGDGAVERQRGNWRSMAKIALIKLDAPPIRVDVSENPVTIAYETEFDRKTDVLKIKRIELFDHRLNGRAAGTIAAVSTKPTVDLDGKIEIDWNLINKEYIQTRDPDAFVAGGDATFRVKGPISNDAAGLEGEARIAIASAKFHGIRLGSTEIAARRTVDGSFRIDPVHAKLNDGDLTLIPMIENVSEAGDEGFALVFDERTGLKDAVVDDEVSRRVVAFAAPMLAEATRVHGKVSADVTRARVPLTHPENQPPARFEGRVQFNDVEFVPGPVMEQVYQVVGIDRPPILKLEDPVTLDISEKRIAQSGLAIPIGKRNKIEFAGWVDFDRNLALDTSIPIIPRLGDNPAAFVNQMASVSKLKLPIRGTLDKPKIDGDALKSNLKSMGINMLTQGGLMGIANLIDQLAKPRDPSKPAPPPAPRLTPEERRELREERRAERLERRERNRIERMQRKIERDGFAPIPPPRS